MMKDEIMVSINCVTYNQEEYIEDALDSFLKQQTTFKYEILLHDDASTDRTPDIIREYEVRYPGIIRVMYQEENQYSQGIETVGLTFNYPRARGKYIADCDGDDYWTDPYKLQKQIDFMESHPGCSMCFHDAILVDGNKSYLNPYPSDYKRIAGNKDIKELDFIPTSSRVIRKSALGLDNIPTWLYRAPYGDFSTMLLCSNAGYIYYMNEQMSAYRTNITGSILYQQSQQYKQDSQLKINRLKSRIEELHDYNEWSNYQNDRSVQALILDKEFEVDCIECNFSKIRNKKYQEIYKKLDYLTTLKIYARCFIPDKAYLKLHEIKSAVTG